MTLFTSTDFASISASGTDWRDTSKNILEQLETIIKSSDDFNFGFLYISDHLADDAHSILNLFKTVLKIDNWIGSVGMGVIGMNGAQIDAPAISAMIGRLPDDSFRIFPAENKDEEANTPPENMAQWLIENPPMLAIMHGDPIADKDPQETLRAFESTTNSFIVGGLTSSRGAHYQIANGIHSNAISGAFFTDKVQVSTALSQGCLPISKTHTVTKADDLTILELDDRRALDVFQDDLRLIAEQRSGISADEFLPDLKSLENEDKIPKEYKTLFKGQVHVALPLSQSDQNDYMVRNITGIYSDEGSISISDNISTGDQIIFVERDDNTIASDLSKALVKLRKRVQAERGCFEPKAALYVSCIARGFNPKSNQSECEIGLIKDIIGDIPLTGFYAGGEINNARLYGYAGVLTLFF